MTIAQLDTENADRNITSVITVLTHTPDASNPMVCLGYIALGDGSKNLDGTGGAFELTITVGGQTVQPAAQSITFGTEVRSSVWTTPFPVPANAEVILRVKSPNAADTDVDVTAYLFDASAAGAAVGSVTGAVGSVGSGGITAATFAADAITAAKIASDVGDEIAASLLDLAAGVESGVTVRQALRAMASVLAGTATGGPGVSAFKAIANAGTTRVTSTADADGDRSSILLNL